MPQLSSELGRGRLGAGKGWCMETVYVIAHALPVTEMLAAQSCKHKGGALMLLTTLSLPHGNRYSH